MKYQSKNKPYCGPTALGNALRFYRKEVSNRKLLEVTDAKKVDGCNEHLLMQGIRELGFDYEEVHTNSTKVAKMFVGAMYPTLICVHTDEPWDHWVVVIPTIEGNWLLIDSENSKKNVAQNGVHVVSWQQLVRLWRAPANAHVDPGDRAYYGIAIKRL